MVRKSACKHDTTDDSDSEETNDFEMPLPVLHESYTKTKECKNKFSRTQGNFQPIIHEFDNGNSGIKASEKSNHLFSIFFKFSFWRNS